MHAQIIYIHFAQHTDSENSKKEMSAIAGYLQFARMFWKFHVYTHGCLCFDLHCKFDKYFFDCHILAELELSTRTAVCANLTCILYKYSPRLRLYMHLYFDCAVQILALMINISNCLKAWTALVCLQNFCKNIAFLLLFWCARQGGGALQTHPTHLKIFNVFIDMTRLLK